MRISIATVCSVAIFALPSVTAWGTVAHRVICLIAKEFLTKEGLEYVDAYLHQQPMESIGSWADAERRSSRKSDAAEYHFTPSMDPSGAKCVYDDHRDCADGICLSSAIARHNRILRESTSPDDPGAENSLKYIIHYVSDVCQPLHTDGYDKGGSSTIVRFGNTDSSLHTVWDTHMPNKRIWKAFKNKPVVYANYLIESIKTGENKVLSESWTSKLSIDAVNDIGNSMVAIEYTAESYELSCSVVWAKYNEYRMENFCGSYYRDVIKTFDMQISKAGLRVAKWLNELARLHSQTKVEAATLPTAQPGKSNIERHPSPPRESMPQSKKDPSMSSKKLVSGAQKPDDPPPSQSDHDDHQVADDDATGWQVVTKETSTVEWDHCLVDTLHLFDLPSTYVVGEQTTIDKGIRLFTGARLSTAIGPLLVETGIGSLLTRSLVSRVRLLERSVTKRTPINAICSGTDNDVFTLNVQRAVGKIPALVLISSDQTAVQEQILADTTSQTKDSQATAFVCINGDSANKWRLCITPKLLSTSIAHLVVECEQVTGHRIQSGLVPAIQKSRLRLLGCALDPGVENVYTWLRGGVLNGEADLDQRWLVGRDCGA
ncbi:hypothetical protein BASA83_003294 [Batrachochytrium salamandrivorans]|nr:hypothetical protein BASA83_003294 [Batrachochytrium salamandrivorans]